MKELNHLVNRIRIRIPGSDFWVQQLPLLLLRVIRGQHPLNHVGSAFTVAEILRREFPSKDFENEDSEAVDIGLGRDSLVLEIIRGFVGEHGLSRVAGVHQRVKRIVAEDWLVVLVQKDVAGLEVA
ncbi:hypothetical protein PanWU01x14_112450, partial [Parasponia andersonii]